MMVEVIVVVEIMMYVIMMIEVQGLTVIGEVVEVMMMAMEEVITKVQKLKLVEIVE